MATIREIRRRIIAVKSTRKITRAMQLVAAAKLRRAQENILKLRPYALRMERVMTQVAARSKGDPHPLLVERTCVPRSLLIVVTGDTGLSGGFNTNVFKAVRAYMEERAGCGGADLFCVGRKGRDFFTRQGSPIAGEQVNFFNRLRYSDAADITGKVVGLYLQGAYDRVDVLYNEFRSAIRQELTIKPVLPFVPAEIPTNDTLIEYLYEPDETAVLDVLIPYNIEVQVWRILLESYAAEMGAKMTAMDAATENANKLLSSLSVSYNHARQAQITKEITEIVGGSEALG